MSPQGNCRLIGQTGCVAIFEVDLGDEGAFHDWYAAVQEVWVDAWPGDPPWAEEPEMRTLFLDREYNHRVLFAGRTTSGDVAGAAEVGMPQKDNLRVANVEVSVRPEFRGLGIGRALLERAEEFASVQPTDRPPQLHLRPPSDARVERRRLCQSRRVCPCSQ